MPTFTFTARASSGGGLRHGEIRLDSREEVVAHLHRQRLIPVAIREKERGPPIHLVSGIKTRDLVIFTRQFATMINAGLPLVECLGILGEQTENGRLRVATRKILDEVEAGSTLADALRGQPKVFTRLYVNMVEAGEAAGILDTMLLRLATFLEKSDALARKIKSALIYPAVVLLVATGAVAMLLFLVIPTFQDMFASAGVPLPWPTQIVLLLSGFLRGYWWTILAGAALLGVLGRRYYRTDRGEKAVDGGVLRIPILGELVRKAAVARFSRTLGVLVASGVSILEGLEITARTVGNRVIHDAVLGSRRSIARGETISGPLEASGVFPPMVVHMIHVGEQTGGLDEMLARIADFCDEEVDVAVDGLISALEPIMIVVLGVVVGGMIVAMYLPIFDMITAVG